MNAFRFDVLPSTLPGVVLCAVSGFLDVSSSSELEKLATQEIKSSSEVLLFDFSGLEYISSQGLGALLALHKGQDQGGGGVILHSLGERIRKIFEITGMDLAIHSYADLAEAMRRDPLLKNRLARGIGDGV